VTIHDSNRITFASDNYAGVHQQILDGLAIANGGHVSAYGDDPYTAELGAVIRDLFGERAEIFPVFNGTGANVLALTAAMPRWGAVVCSAHAHIHTDEGGAPERITGLKLYPVATPDAKLTPELVAIEAWGYGFEHRAQPLVLSITQTTELGTLYSLDELRALTAFAHEKGMVVHMDGARLWNAAAALGVTFKQMTTDVGVDILSFGATKIGGMGAEAVVVLNPEVAPGMLYVRKLIGQLGSKLRFVSQQYLTLLTDNLGMDAARHANAMAALLRETLEGAIVRGEAPGLAFTQATEANAVFATLPRAAIDQLRDSFHFYDWDESINEVRWMTAFDTTESDVLAFAQAIGAALRAV
jgi:threonine aldolase